MTSKLHLSEPNLKRSIRRVQIHSSSPLAVNQQGAEPVLRGGSCFMPLRCFPSDVD